MRVGFDHYTIGHRELLAAGTLEYARDHGLEGVQFLEPAAISPGLDHEELAAVRRRAEELNLYLEIGLPSPNPVRRSRELDRTVTPAEHARDLRPHVEAVAALGCTHARAYVGDRHDRFRTDTPWPAQRAATTEVLRLLSHSMRDLGLRVALETHADLTVDELLWMVEALGPDVAGVTLDTGNLAMRLEDPIEAVRRLRPLVLCTHVKDAVLAFTPRGLNWQARPVGSGILPLADMLALLHEAKPSVNLSIELHPRTYDLPIYDRSWLAFFPDLRPESLAAVVRLAALCEHGYAAGTLDRPENVEAVPWSERHVTWLAQSAGYLKKMVKMLDKIHELNG